MSVDIQYIVLVNELQLLSAEDIAGAVPRTIRLVGRGGFNTAQRVLINDYGVDSFTLVTDEILLVNPPPLFDALTVTDMSFAVVTGSYSGIGKARLMFGSTKNVRKVEGLQKLIQQVVKVLLSNARSNKFNIQDGGGLVQALGPSLSEASKSRIAAQISASITTTEEQVKAAQTGVSGLAASERLLSMTLEDIQFLTSEQRVEATLRLMTFAGRSVSFPMAL